MAANSLWFEYKNQTPALWLDKPILGRTLKSLGSKLNRILILQWASPSKNHIHEMLSFQTYLCSCQGSALYISPVNRSQQA
jgi:hypothetical protein